MENSYSEPVFVLYAFNETRMKKQIFFGFSIIVYVLTIFVNLTVILTILLEKALHEPMYIFLCNLCVNDICGSISFYPKLLLDLLSDSHVASYSACMIQIFAVYTYFYSEFTNLTFMAYDRYVAICKPLEYHSIMTPRRVGMLVQMTWSLAFFETIAGIVLAVRLPLCGSRIDKLYCITWEVVKLSCVDTTLNKLFGYFFMTFHLLQIMIVIISYVLITRTCVQSKTEHSKFIETCLPHLITLAIYMISILCDTVSSRINSDPSMLALQNSLSIEYLVVPPLLNPIIYCLKMKQIRRSMWKIFIRKMTTPK